METAKRLKTVKEYYFSRKLREIAALKEQGHEVLNLAIGSPDLPPHESIVETLRDAACEPNTNGYQSYQGLPELRAGIAAFYLKKYEVELDAGNGILPMMGSKEAITHVSLAYLNSGDQVLIPEIGYPTYQSVTEMVEAVPVRYPLRASKGYEPDWDFFDELDPAVKIVWINYPHMPTGTQGSKVWFQKFVNIARKHDLLLVHDNPYSFILNDRPLSIFNVKGAEEVAIELNSLSKTYNMAGWRVGWACGSPELIHPVLNIKSNMDSGMYYPIQKAAIQALALDDQWHMHLNNIYRSRRNKVFEFFDALGCTYEPSQQGMFVWANVSSSTGEQLVDHLLTKHQIFISPGTVFGPAGADFVRVSLCSPVSIFQEAINRLKS